jgi:cation diffusion facilitator family transporter
MPKITRTGALKVSLLAVISVIAVEGFAGVLTGSLALLSDSAHATFDAFATLILLLATRLSLKPADEDHTYGHGKFESLGALTGGIILLLLALGIVTLALSRLSQGSLVHLSFVGYAAATYTLGVDVLRMLILFTALRTGSLTVRADYYHAISDFCSTTLVFIALALTSLGHPVGDTAVSFVLAAMLGLLSVRLIHASVLDLSDAVSGKLVKSILQEIRKTDDVLKCKELRVRRVGSMTFVDAVIAVSPFADVAEADKIAGKVEINLKKFLGPSSVLIHIEPIEWDVPVELKIRDATAGVQGARGIHNLSVTNVGNGLYVKLHVQVEPSLQLEEAHGIAELIEKGIESSVPGVRQVTVHLEPSMPETSRGTIVDDEDVSASIRSVVQAYPDVLEISAISTYSIGDTLHVDVHCIFAGNTPISELHEIITKIEEGVRQRIGNAIVTVHPEPAQK